MSDILTLALALLAGALLGVFFFGGLWWTVQKGVASEQAGALVPRQPAAANRRDSGWILFCFAGSLVEARGVPCLDFCIARVIVVKWLTRYRQEQTPWKRRASHAP